MAVAPAPVRGSRGGKGGIEVVEGHGRRELLGRLLYPFSADVVHNLGVDSDGDYVARGVPRADVLEELLVPVHERGLIRDVVGARRARKVVLPESDNHFFGRRPRPRHRLLRRERAREHLERGEGHLRSVAPVGVADDAHPRHRHERHGAVQQPRRVRREALRRVVRVHRRPARVWAARRAREHPNPRRVRIAHKLDVLLHGGNLEKLAPQRHYQPLQRSLLAVLRPRLSVEAQDVIRARVEVVEHDLRSPGGPRLEVLLEDVVDVEGVDAPGRLGVVERHGRLAGVPHADAERHAGEIELHAPVRQRGVPPEPREHARGDVRAPDVGEDARLRRR
mmetsp:Transcript_27693/g.90582  ORF Transcript_27693/g.90582 Transcript_27693/m.90582 type:complete len:336 (+) Transcript_27693:1479-2486(+)